MQMFARRLRLLTLADGAITTTSKIASHLEGLGIKTLLLPNMVRSHEVRLKSHDGDGSVSLLCMSGSPTHYRDFAEIEDSLLKVMSRHPEVNLTLLGRFRDGIRILGLNNVRHINRVPYGQMMRIVDQSDICLVPLELTEFNNAKSCLKYIECGARGVPVIASPTADYARVIRHGHNGLLAETPFEWIDVLEAVICGEFSSQAIGMAAMRDVEQNFCIESAKIDIKQWLFEEI